MYKTDGVSKVLGILSTKQRWHIVRCLFAGHTRFNQIKRECRMSSAALTRTLKYLENKGIVSKQKRAKDALPEYVLTKTGLEFSGVIDEMDRLGRRV